MGFLRAVFDFYAQHWTQKISVIITPKKVDYDHNQESMDGLTSGFLKFWSQNFRNPEVCQWKTSGFQLFGKDVSQIFQFWFLTKFWTLYKN